MCVCVCVDWAKMWVLVTALNEALTAEVQRLKIATAELSADPSKFQQLSISPQMFQLHQQQPQNGSKTTKQDSNQ